MTLAVGWTINTEQFTYICRFILAAGVNLNLFVYKTNLPPKENHGSCLHAKYILDRTVTFISTSKMGVLLKRGVHYVK